jgi:aryl-alcohol dehydrogenase-like predicted oxidoreductase
MKLHGATSTGTSAFRHRLRSSTHAGHFREAFGLTVSSIGLGTYLGHHDEQADSSYSASIIRAFELGSNVIDTAANYRFQRSERVIGQTLTALVRSGAIAREEIVVATKGGYLPFDGEPPRSREEMSEYLNRTFIATGICSREDFVQGSHSMAPQYLAHQLDQSLRNLQLETIDVYYIHNPESQFAGVSRADFENRIRAAFEFLESAVDAGKIARYGVATWNGFRVSESSPEYLSLEAIVDAARSIGGDAHHFEVVQLPFNLSMIEAATFENQHVRGTRVSFLDAASELGISVMTSAALLQARLTRALPQEVRDLLREMTTDAQRALQVARSARGIAVALVGMGTPGHVEENLAIAALAPMPPSDVTRLLKRAT